MPNNTHFSHKTSTIMIDIDFKSGFQVIQNKGVHYRFSFADLTTDHVDEIEAAAAKIIREFTETDISGMHTTFIRDGSNGEIYAVAFISSDQKSFHQEIKFPEGKEHFLRQFADWVLIEPEDAQQFDLHFSDMVEGWLPQHWYFITKCLEHPNRAKSKNAFIRKWSSGNHFLSYDPGTHMFKLEVMHGAFDMSTVCKFYPNEIFTQPE